MGNFGLGIRQAIQLGIETVALVVEAGELDLHRTQHLFESCKEDGHLAAELGHLRDVQWLSKKSEGNMNARVQSDGRRVPPVSAPIPTGDSSVIVESDTSTREGTLRQEEFEARLDEFRNRHAGMLEYLQSH